MLATLPVDAPKIAQEVINNSELGPFFQAVHGTSKKTPDLECKIFDPPTKDQITPDESTSSSHWITGNWCEERKLGRSLNAKCESLARYSCSTGGIHV